MENKTNLQIAAASATEFNIALERNPKAAALRLIDKGLGMHRAAVGIDYDHRALAVLVRDREGMVSGGLHAVTGWAAMSIRNLWLPVEARGRGIGTQLVCLAEAEGIRRECHTAWVETMSFDARGFYERCGYILFGSLENSPAGHSHFFLKKSLAHGKFRTRVESGVRAGS